MVQAANIISQVFEIAQKMLLRNEQYAERNIQRIYAEFEEMGYTIDNPLGRVYKETDTQLEVRITGDLKPGMKVTRVLKPVVYHSSGDEVILIQKGIVLVE